MSFYFLWGSITALGFVLSLQSFIVNKSIAQERTDKYSEKNDIAVRIALRIFSISAVLFIIAHIILMYFLLDFAVEKPLRNNLISLIAFWPVISRVSLLYAVNYKIKAASHPELRTRSTVILAAAIAAIVLYFCFCGAVYLVYIT